MKKDKHGKVLSPQKKTAETSSFVSLIPILLITVVVFSPVFTNDFVNWDDIAYIIDNPVIKDLSLENISHIFNFNTYVVGNYHPLTVLSLAIEYKIIGAKPLLYHIDNLLIHLLNICLVFLISWKLTGRKFATFIITILFAIHPMHVESVVWAAERKDVLYTLFFLLSLISYIYYDSKKARPFLFYSLTILFFIFSLLSKAQAVVLPFVLILIDYWQGRKYSPRLLLEKIPFFLLAILFGFLAIKAQSNSLTEERLLYFSLPDRIFFAAYNLVAYPFKLIWPYNLSCFYGFPYSENLWLVKLALPISIIILGFIFYKLRKNKLIMFGVLFFLSTIFIVIQLLPVGNAIIADRYTYIPYLGLFFIIAMSLDKLIERNHASKNLIVGLISIQLFVFAIASFGQAKSWKNSESLWTQALSVNDREALSNNNIGVVYMGQKNYVNALEHFRKAIANKENYPEVYQIYNNLGWAFRNLKNFNEGIAAYNQSLAIESNYVPTWFDRGLCYSEMEKYPQAISDFTKVISMQPSADAYYSRGLAFKNSGKYDEAIADYNQAISLNPKYITAYLNLANAYYKKGNYDSAYYNYEKVLELDPANGQCYLNRSIAKYKQGRYEEALKDYDLAYKYNVENSALLNAIQQALTKK